MQMTSDRQFDPQRAAWQYSRPRDGDDTASAAGQPNDQERLEQELETLWCSWLSAHQQVEVARQALFCRPGNNRDLRALGAYRQALGNEHAAVNAYIALAVVLDQMAYGH